MLAELLVTPRSQQEWEIWSFAHRDNHVVIRQAIQSKIGNNLQEYDLDPIPPTHIEDWLARNQQAHNDMNQALQLQGSDLGTFDFKNPESISSRIYSHYLEHFAANQALEV